MSYPTSTCQHIGKMCTSQRSNGVRIANPDCPSNCHDPNCPLIHPWTRLRNCESHPPLKCSNGNCPSNCPNERCPWRLSSSDVVLKDSEQWDFNGICLPFHLITTILCLAAFGLPRPRRVWEKFETSWDDAKSSVVDRLGNAAIVVCDSWNFVITKS